mmetsp:Transcript_33755/g.100711  ORF Transcript_33755/g.100711 Transcript_33755/m.100711 type:complete len:226 (-) Transcript_33755:154-831(-)
MSDELGPLDNLRRHHGEHLHNEPHTPDQRRLLPEGETDHSRHRRRALLLLLLRPGTFAPFRPRSRRVPSLNESDQPRALDERARRQEEKRPSGDQSHAGGPISDGRRDGRQDQEAASDGGPRDYGRGVGQGDGPGRRSVLVLRFRQIEFQFHLVEFDLEDIFQRNVLQWAYPAGARGYGGDASRVFGAGDLRGTEPFLRRCIAKKTPALDASADMRRATARNSKR